MRKLFDEAWERFKIIGAIVGDGNARVISLVFYFTVLVPFGIIARLFTDPLHLKQSEPRWIDRESVPTDLDSAKEQG